MSEKIHDRALHLIAQARVEGITEADSTWLRAHLEECEFCTGHVQQTDRALRSLRSASIQLPQGLASRTQFRVRLRARSENVLEYRN